MDRGCGVEQLENIFRFLVDNHNPNSVAAFNAPGTRCFIIDTIAKGRVTGLGGHCHGWTVWGSLPLGKSSGSFDYDLLNEGTSSVQVTSFNRPDPFVVFLQYNAKIKHGRLRTFPRCCCLFPFAPWGPGVSLGA